MRVLIRLPNWIGDVVMATPFLRAVRAGFPAGAHEVVATGIPTVLGMLEAGGWWERAIPWPKKTGPLYPLRFGRALRAEHFDLALLLPNSWSSGIVAFAAGIPRRVGYEKAGRSLLLTDRLRARHVGRLRPIPMVDYYLRIAAHVGCPVERTGRLIELPAPPAALERAESYHRKLGIGADERPIAINCGASFGGSKKWTTPGFAAVGDHFAAQGRRILIYGGPADRPLVDEVLAAMKCREAAAAVTDAPLADLCAHMKRCALLISTDSGGRHFGLAAGIPVVVVMGSTHPGYSEADAHDSYVVLLEKVECWPCHLRECPIDHRCMTRITPAQVIEAAESFLAGRKPFGGARPWVTPAGAEDEKWRPALMR